VRRGRWGEEFQRRLAPALFAERQASSGNPLARGYTGAEIQIIRQTTDQCYRRSTSAGCPNFRRNSLQLSRRRGLSAAPLG